MDDRHAAQAFGGLVALGIAFGLLAVVMGTPPQTGEPYSLYGPRAVEIASSAKRPAPGGPATRSRSTSRTAGATASATSGAPGESAVAGPAGGDEPEARPVDQPARVGQPLMTIEEPPPDTLAMLDPGVAKAGAAYDVAFAPYGAGPQASGMPQLIIKVISSAPLTASASSFKFANTNALVEVAPDSAGRVTTGGRYRGVLTLRDDQGVLTFVLSRVVVVGIR